MKCLAVFCLLAFIVAVSQAAPGGTIPKCVVIGQGETVQFAVMGANPASEELLARLAYAEGLSTGFPDDPLVYEAIAWGVMNRVRLGEVSAKMQRRYGSGVSGVIFRKGQFNPAVSARSRFSKDFLCPQNPGRWAIAVEAARKSLTGKGSPFIQSAWEKANGISLVVNFYYPQSPQARGPLPPWEGSPALKFIGDISIGGVVLSAERIRFYRLTNPPGDIKR